MEGLDSGNWNDMVIAALGLLRISGCRRGGCVNCDKVRNRARSEKCALKGRGVWCGGRDANTTTAQDCQYAFGLNIVLSMLDGGVRAYRAPIAPLKAASRGTILDAIPPAVEVPAEL